MDDLGEVAHAARMTNTKGAPARATAFSRSPEKGLM
jgi:hypothetical protein